MRAAADTESATTAGDDFLAYWESDGRNHFREEEEVLLPACAGALDLDEPVVAKVLTDHVRIRHLADELARSGRPRDGMLQKLAAELEGHVRREERELFPLIERSLPDHELRQLVARLRH